MISNSFLFLFMLAAERPKTNLPEFVLWFSIPAMVIGFVALLTVILKLVKTLGDAQICRVPLADTNEVEINATGKLYLCLEVPMFSSMTNKNKNYELFDRQRDDAAIEMKSAVSLVLTKSGSTRKFPVRVFQITKAGKYLLKVSGFEPQSDYAGYFLTIARPTSLKSVFYIFGIILTATMFVGGLVFTLIISGAQK